MDQYKVTARNKARRMRDRAKYDLETVHELLDSSIFCHIAYVVDGQLYCTPTLFWRRGNEVFWHGSVGSRMLKGQAKNPEICMTVTMLDSIVLTRGAFYHAVNYRSVMLFGRATLVEDREERLLEVKELIDNFLPGRTAQIIPPTEAELKQATFMKMPIDQASAKIRNHPASHEIAEYRGHPVWAGEIPIVTHIGAATPCSTLDPAIGEGDDVKLYQPGARLDETLLRIRRGRRQEE